MACLGGEEHARTILGYSVDRLRRYIAAIKMRRGDKNTRETRALIKKKRPFFCPRWFRRAQVVENGHRQYGGIRLKGLDATPLTTIASSAHHISKKTSFKSRGKQSETLFWK
jgi:hypothetical protein